MTAHVLSDVEVDAFVYQVVRSHQDLRPKSRIMDALREITQLPNEAIAAALLRLHRRMTDCPLGTL